MNTEDYSATVNDYADKLANVFAEMTELLKSTDQIVLGAQEYLTARKKLIDAVAILNEATEKASAERIRNVQ